MTDRNLPSRGEAVGEGEVVVVAHRRLLEEEEEEREEVDWYCWQQEVEEVA